MLILSFVEKALKELMKKVQNAAKQNPAEASAAELEEGRKALSEIFRNHSIDEAKNKTFFEDIFNWRFKE